MIIYCYLYVLLPKVLAFSVPGITVFNRFGILIQGNKKLFQQVMIKLPGKPRLTVYNGFVYYRPVAPRLHLL